jgi:sulfur-carrier protein
MTRVLLFGRLRDVAGWREIDLDPASITLGDLKRRLADAWPELGVALASSGVQVAVDRALTRGEVVLSPGAEVAFMPPMSGG